MLLNSLLILRDTINILIFRCPSICKVCITNANKYESCIKWNESNRYKITSSFLNMTNYCVSVIQR